MLAATSSLLVNPQQEQMSWRRFKQELASQQEAATPIEEDHSEKLGEDAWSFSSKASTTSRSTVDYGDEPSSFFKSKSADEEDQEHLFPMDVDGEFESDFRAYLEEYGRGRSCEGECGEGLMHHAKKKKKALEKSDAAGDFQNDDTNKK